MGARLHRIQAYIIRLYTDSHYSQMQFEIHPICIFCADMMHHVALSAAHTVLYRWMVQLAHSALQMHYVHCV